MNYIEILRAKSEECLKAKNTDDRAFYQSLIADGQRLAKDKGVIPTDSHYISAMKSELKQIDKALSEMTYSPELLSEYIHKRQILMDLLPPTMTKDAMLVILNKSTKDRKFGPLMAEIQLYAATLNVLVDSESAKETINEFLSE